LGFRVLRLIVMFGTLRSGSGFFERIPCLLQALSDCSFGGLCAMFESLAGSLRPMLDCLTCFDSSFFDRLAGFSDRILIL
jgi:hypothetical protein